MINAVEKKSAEKILFTQNEIVTCCRSVNEIKKKLFLGCHKGAEIRHINLILHQTNKQPKHGVVKI